MNSISLFCYVSVVEQRLTESLTVYWWTREGEFLRWKGECISFRNVNIFVPIHFYSQLSLDMIMGIVSLVKRWVCTLVRACVWWSGQNDFSGFGDLATFMFGKISLSDHDIVHGVKKWNQIESAQKIHVSRGWCQIHAHHFWWVWPLWFQKYCYFSYLANYCESSHSPSLTLLSSSSSPHRLYNRFLCLTQ